MEQNKHKKIPAIEKLSEQSQALYDAVNDEPDLPCILISTSFLDQCLTSLIERFFIKSSTAKNMLDPGRGVLGSFSSRADLCYCLDLISKSLYQNLKIIGKIRNRFAHSYLSLTFDDAKICKLCEEISFPKIAAYKRVDCESGESSEDIDSWERFKHPRQRFTINVVLIVNRLLLTGLSAERKVKRKKGAKGKCKVNIDFFTRGVIEEEIGRIKELIDSGIFLPKNSQSPLVKSAFIEVLICLRDLMYKTEEYVTRISFDDDIVKAGNIKDVTDTIKYVRDALCHLDSDKHYLENGNIRASYNVAYGKKQLLKIGGFTQASDYDDDICFFFGTQKIYLNRHIIRAFEEAKNKLLPLIKASRYQ